MEQKDKLHATYRLRIAICYRSKRHLPLRDRCPRVRQTNQETKLKQGKAGLKSFVASLGMTSLDSRIFSFDYNVLVFFILKAYFNLGLLWLGQMAVIL
jgi:hypothetical protein